MSKCSASVISTHLGYKVVSLSENLVAPVERSTYGQGCDDLDKVSTNSWDAWGLY